MTPSRDATPSRTSLILAFAAIYLIWGSTYLGIRVAVETIPPFVMAGLRFFSAGTVLFTLLLLRGAAWPTLRQWRDQAIVGTFLLLGGNAVVSWAEQRVPSGLTALIIGAGPLIMALLEWSRPGGARPSPSLWLGVAIGFAGLFVLLGPQAVSAGEGPPLVCVAALIFATVAWWIGSLYGKQVKSGTEPLMAAAIQMLCGSIAMGLAVVVSGEASRWRLAAVSPRSWLAFAYLAVIGSLVTYPIYIWLLRHSTPARVSTFAYVNPIVAVVLGWAILQEPVTPRMIISGVAVLVSVAIITRRAPKARVAS